MLTESLHVTPVEMTGRSNYNLNLRKLHTGLSLRAGGRGFSPATKRVASGYFYWKIEEK